VTANARHVLFVGGGSAGHVVPSIPLIHYFRDAGWRVSYVGSGAPEQDLIGALQVEFFTIPSGKLRRYWSVQNVVDVFRLMAGLWQATRLLRRLQPDVVFSKGGFVAFPVVLGAWLNRIPVVAHESDLTPGLANRLSAPFVDVVCTSFAETQLGRARVEYTGAPLRPELLDGVADRGRKMCGFDAAKPLLLVVGGSLGSDVINTSVRRGIRHLTKRFNVAHVCGPGRVDVRLRGQPGYRQFEYVDSGWGDMLAAADLVVSRAGANAVFELAALGKPSLLIPLSARASRGDQIDNAEYAKRQGWSRVLAEEDLDHERLLTELTGLVSRAVTLRQHSAPSDATATIAGVIESTARPPKAQ
jgi:UDP-N-acetylglucosamine--N-acetylmuramyl-(pentapeptide) pyrophosphoryl-undecaprenol N-acetylglucosamine transferase